MLSPFQLIVGVWLAAWPLPAGAAALAAPPPLPAAARTPEEVHHAAAVENHEAASLLALDDESLMDLIAVDPSLVGPLSIGGPGRGLLWNAVALARDARWEILPRSESWATSETIDALQTAIDTVHELFPETPPIFIGDMSARDGGRLKRHESHQSGRDVDLGFFFKAGKGFPFAPGTADNLDLARNWALVRALVVRTDVERILLDTRVQKLLYRYAASIAEDGEWLDRVFGFVRGSRDAIIQHVKGHRNHYHVRFFNPVAQELGRRVHPLLVQMQLLQPPVFTVRHLVRPGQTIGHLAEQYGTTVQAIMRANGLKTTHLRARRSYRIPVRGVVGPGEPIVVRPRILPPQTPAALASLDWPTQTH